MSHPTINRQSLVNFGQNRAIIIGIDSYPKITNGHLSTPVSDAEAFAEVLVTYQGFKQEDITLLKNPTKKDLEDFLGLEDDELKENDGNNDTSEEPKNDIDKREESTSDEAEENVDLSEKSCLIFYYAGHGVAGDLDGNGPAGYLLPSDAEMQSTSLANNTTLIQMDKVFKALEKFNSHHTLLILDCCFAGAFRRIQNTRASFGLGHRPMTRPRFLRYTNKESWQVLVSAGPAEKAADWISDRGKSIETTGKAHSPFAKALIDALSPNADIDVKPKGQQLGDGVITSFELFLFLHEQVEKLTREDKDFKPQNPDIFPMSRHDGGQFVFCDPRFPLNQLKWAKRRNDNPYKGLEQFDIEDSGYYFGRETDSEALAELMQLGLKKDSAISQSVIPSILILTGPSGCGKSSLIKAGLLPKFLVEGYELFQLRPGEKPWKLLTYQNIASTNDKSTDEDEIKYSWEEIVGEVANILPNRLDPQKKQILFLDQYEEIFTECSDHEQQLLEELLLELFTRIQDTQASNQLRIILSMRSDFEWQLARSNFGKEFWAKKEYTQLYRISAPRLDELRSALVNPALMLAYEFEEKNEESLVDIILEDLNYHSTTLPLLSYTMQEFVNANKKKRKARRKFTIATYQKRLGGVKGLLSKRMDEIYEGFAKKGQKVGIESQKQQLMKYIFLRMVRLNDGEYSRRRVFRRPNLDELAYFTHTTKQQILEEVLTDLENHHIISIGGSTPLTSGQKEHKSVEKVNNQHRSIIPYVELVHDSLINVWGRGKQWINEFGKVNLVLQHQLWQAVVEFSSHAPSIPTNDATEVSEAQQSYLWDNSPQLQQVFFSIIDPKDELKKEENFDKREGATYLWNDDLEKLEKREKVQKLLTWLETNNIIGERQDNDSINPEAVLSNIFSSSQSWLNQQEANFVLQSWKKKNEWIKQLKNERDEALATALAAKAVVKQFEDPTIAYNMAYAALQMKKIPEIINIINSISGKNYQYYKHKYAENNSRILSVAFSPDGKCFVTGGRDGIIRLWDRTSGKVTSTLSEDDFDIYSVTFSSDGQYILTGGRDDMIRLWDRNSGKEIKTLYGDHFEIFSVAFSPDGQYILTGGRNGTVRLWDLDSGKEIKTFSGHTFEVMSVAFSPDGQYFLTGSNDKTAKLWKCTLEEAVATFSGHNKTVMSVAFSPDGQYVLTGSSDKTAKLWENISEKKDIKSWKEVRTFSGHNDEVLSVAFSPDGQHLLTGSADKTAKLWERTSGVEVSILLGHTDGIHSVAFSQDMRYMVTGSYDNTTKLWEYISKEKNKAFSCGHTSSVNSVAFSPDGKYFLTGSNDQTAKLWERTSEGETKTFFGHTSYVNSVAFSPDGQYILTGSGDETAKLWNLNSGEEVRTFSGHTDKVYSVAFSQDGQYILTGSRDKTAKLWNINSGKKIRTFSGHNHIVTSIVFSPDGQHILTGSIDHTAKLWDLTSGEEIHTFLGHTQEVYCVAFSQDGQHILTGSADHTAKLWDIISGKEIRTFSGHTSYVNSVTFSPNEQFILTGGEDNIAKLWNINSGEEIKTFSGHTQEVFSVAFSPDGQGILTGSGDNTAKLWNHTSGQEIRTLSGHTDAIHSVVFSSDGQYFLTGSEDQTAKLWNLSSGEVVKTLSKNTDWVDVIALSSGGQYILTGNKDHTAKLWNIISGEQIRTFYGHTETVESVAFSSDRKYILTGSGDHTAKLWDLSVGEVIKTFSGHTDMVNSVAFASDGQYILTSSSDNTAKLWNINSGKEIRTFTGHSSSRFIRLATFSLNGKYILIVDGKGNVKLWDRILEKEIRTFSPHKYDVFSATFSPDGQYILTGGSENKAKLWACTSGKLIQVFSGHTDDIYSVAFSPDGQSILTGSKDKSARLWRGSVFSFDSSCYKLNAEERKQHGIPIEY